MFFTEAMLLLILDLQDQIAMITKKPGCLRPGFFVAVTVICVTADFLVR
jgi:hypothetical protein